MVNDEKRTTTEPFLLEKERNSLFPIRHPDLYNAYLAHRSAFWTEQEVLLSADEFDSLPEDAQFYLSNVLGFFAKSDMLVNSNIDERFLGDFENNETRMFYHYQLMAEDVHTAQYQRLIEVYIKDPA
ncbi:MAG: ribonucleoside-diphosphate reductase, partial [Pseudomonas sp.]|nr:ribonucleoside-diphosphate reductase [Pseudomonas sp.]